MRRIALIAAALAVAAPVALAKGSFPETIPLPNGWQPEGIAIGKGKTFYVGSIPTGSIYRGDLRTGQGAPFISVTGRAATGLKYDHGRLFVSGAGQGKGFVYDTKSGALLRELQLANSPGATFVNDVVVTRNAAYFTDSNRPVVYKVPVSNHTIGDPQILQLTGDFQFQAPPALNFNGIEATPNGRTLIAVQTATGKLFTIDPNSGVTNEIELGGGSVPNGDGILLAGRTLYVVQNRLNQIAVIRLARDLSSGQIVRTITDSDFDVPTTIARHGKRLYAVNARFGTVTPGPTATYNVVQVRR
jgi:sugar lactone lactonase YvrE